MKKKNTLFAIAAALGAGVSAWAVSKYKREKHEAIRQLREGSLLMYTARGPVETAIVGEGPAVLVLHGGGAGYDLGVLFSYPEEGFKFISVSRPGYLRTPLETGPSPSEFADTLAALLDELGIEKAAVFGMSGGGPSTIEFAVRYPETCWGVVLLSAANQPLPSFPASMKFVETILPYSDFLPWLALNTPLMYILSGPKLKAQIGDNTEKQSMLKKLMGTMFPLSLRGPGAFNDIKYIQSTPGYPLDQIKAPTLVIHGDADSIVPFEQGKHSAATIPNAELFIVPGGDHFCFITHYEITKPALLQFLRTYAPG